MRNHWTDALRAAPIRFLIAFFLWGGVTAAFTGTKPFTAQGLLLLGAGLVVTLTVCTQARTRPQYQLLLDTLIVATLLLSLSGFALYGLGSFPLAVGFYYDHMLYGAVFSILLPSIAAISLSPSTLPRRLAAQAALLSGFLALGLAQTRSSWLGLAASFLTFIALWLWVRSSVEKQAKLRSGNNQYVQASLLCVLIVGAVGFLAITTPGSGRVVRRFETLGTTVAHGKEASVEWRKIAWQGASRMIFQKPVIGWGIGCYAPSQFPFTGLGRKIAIMKTTGPTILDEAHNSYLQIAVETGLPGLILWLGVLVSSLWFGLSALRRMTPGGIRQWSLIGSLSALIGQSVDAIANPGWQFGEVNLFLWVTLGLIVALALGVPQKIAEEEARGQETPIRWAGRISLAAVIFAGLLWAIFQTAHVLPMPTL